MPIETPIQRAVRIAGGQSRLADRLGIKQPSVAEWIKRGKAPATRVREISAITGIECEQLRPDVFGASPLTAGNPGRNTNGHDRQPNTRGPSDADDACTPVFPSTPPSHDEGGAAVVPTREVAHA